MATSLTVVGDLKFLFLDGKFQHGFELILGTFLFKIFFEDQWV
jgi:hypothetical protein